MAQETILVVDDDSNIVELVRISLEKEGFQVKTAYDGIQALEKTARRPPALMVLGLMLPDMDGWEVYRKIRAKSDLPVIMLTAHDDDIDKIVGLEIGADDYLTKPFNPRELVARVKAILRRTSRDQRVNSPIHLFNLSIDPAARQVWVSGKPIKLRAKEFDLLMTLIKNKNIVLSRDQLLQLVWGLDFNRQTRTVDMHIANLRAKLAGSSVAIETIWGIGYKLVANQT